MSSKIPTLAARVKENPNDSFSRFALALELLKINQVTKALVLFENIVNTDPGYVGVYYHLAKLYTEINENKKALNTYKEGIKIAEQANDQHAKSELQGALLALELELED
ncbi:MAG: hypothetical protein JJ971_05305 [Balneolaceae bacterium]|nr:hypothetical protein [Balneolaceae bacterium]MBO6545794.1 hypothetical protein [Balneolaceae bacterium]MBO6647190.1 hypothetical protein [Balneolaceae bacterium]